MTETNLYKELHLLFNALPRYTYPFEREKVSGLYILFERGERYQGMDRIVWVGTHLGKDRMFNRLKNHFDDDQRLSMLRRHIGRCYLCKEGKEAYLPIWNSDIKSKRARQLNYYKIDWVLESELEERISEHLQKNFSFAILPGIQSHQLRNRWKVGIIAALAQSPERRYSNNWLGKWHDDDRITASKLWNVTYTKGKPLTQEELVAILEQLPANVIQ